MLGILSAVIAIIFALDAMRKEIKGKDIHLELEMENKLAPIRADSNKVSWVLTHFLANAIRYSPEGETIVITAHQNNGWITVSVKDNGLGIPKAYQEKIFERFVSLETKKEDPKQGSWFST